MTDFTVSLLALLMWRENGPDGLQGMTAAGNVIRNRVAAGWSGGDWLAVMAAHDPGIRWPDDIRNPRFLDVLLKAANIYDGTEPDLTGGALYYANLATPSPWFRDNILGKPEEHPRIGTVGAQTFFA